MHAVQFLAAKREINTTTHLRLTCVDVVPQSEEVFFCVLSLDVKCFCVCAVMPVSANSLGISLGFTRFQNKKVKNI